MIRRCLKHSDDGGPAGLLDPDDPNASVVGTFLNTIPGASADVITLGSSTKPLFCNQAILNVCAQSLPSDPPILLGETDAKGALPDGVSLTWSDGLEYPFVDLKLTNTDTHETFSTGSGFSLSGTGFTYIGQSNNGVYMDAEFTNSGIPIPSGLTENPLIPPQEIDFQDKVFDPNRTVISIIQIITPTTR